MVHNSLKYRFKNAKFSYIQGGGKKFMWKSLKQILSNEKTFRWPDDAATYSSLTAPPSFRPAKKYSDISGLVAFYTDPHSKLNYHNAEEYAVVKGMPSDITTGYLTLRGATSIFG